MKHLTTLLEKGDLTPRERYLLLIQSDVARETTGKETLTEADKKALENWMANNNAEVREWNKYNEAWKLLGRMQIEAEMLYLQVRSEHFRKFFINLQLNFSPLYRDIRGCIAGLKRIKVVTIQEAVAITNKQREQKLKDGLDFDYAVYQLAFESLSEEDKEEFIELYADVEFDHQYLDQEEIIAHLFNGKDELTEKETKKAKEKLAELIAENCYNKFAKEYQFFHYFACIPLAEVGRRFLLSKNIEIKGKLLSKNQECDDEDSSTHDDIQKAVVNYAKNNNVTVEAILKEASLKWLDEGLLDKYTPLFFSNGSILLDRWLKAKAQARATLQKLIDAGELKVRTLEADEVRHEKLYNKSLYDGEFEKAKRTLELLGDSALETKVKNAIDEKTAFTIFSEQVITGESLYNFRGDYKFIKDFKERADEYNANLGLIYSDDDPEHTGEHLDQELLIADKNNSGELNIFSMFGITVHRLAATFEATQFIKETERGGETIVGFTSKMAEQIFQETSVSLIDCYTRFLAFKEIVKKLSKNYEVDLSYMINNRLAIISDCIDQHNDALDGAIEKNKSENRFREKYRKPIKMKNDFYIDKDGLLPNAETMAEWTKKFGDIFIGEF